jgi:hypothetical protein
MVDIPSVRGFGLRHRHLQYIEFDIGFDYLVARKLMCGTTKTWSAGFTCGQRPALLIYNVAPVIYMFSARGLTQWSGPGVHECTIAEGRTTAISMQVIAFPQRPFVCLLSHASIDDRSVAATINP